MKKRRKRNTSRGAQPPKSDPSDSFNTPFSCLGDMLKQVQAESQPDHSEGKAIPESQRESCPPDQRESGDGGEEGESLFREAMAGVEPLQANRVNARVPGPLSKPSRRPLLEGELEAYAQLVDLVSGEGSFDIEYTDEYIEGALVGADPNLLPKLRRGDFSIQAHFDLHGMTTAEAREALERFILSSAIKGLRCVLIIHGRGLNSRDQIPILKERMSSWLKRGRLKQMVLAFATAQPCDGGAGALYVFLRKCQSAFSGHRSKD
jgi:DNA-nicking Smr family endonuclease